MSEPVTPDREALEWARQQGREERDEWFLAGYRAGRSHQQEVQAVAARLARGGPNRKDDDG